MKPELIFSIANTAALLSWLLLAFVPRWRFTRFAVLSGGISLALSAVYLSIVVLFFGQAAGGFDSLASVMRLFTNEWAVLAGWIHYLAFDLYVGSWEVRDAEKHGISHLLVIPCLVFTFLLGPIGYLLYVIVRQFAARKSKEAAA